MKSIILSVLSMVGPVVAFFAKSWIASFFKKEQQLLDQAKEQQTISDFKAACLRAVKTVDLEYALPLKKQRAFADPQKAKAKEMAIEEVKKYYGTQQLVELGMLFAVDAEGLMQLISDTIEAAILLNKKAGSLTVDLVLPDNIKFPNE